jgi:3-deoxy-D-manno-octulosonic acid (KDO) 8-phosphate synthase
LEDNLFYNQTNYSTYFGNVNPVVNFEHNHVLRSSLTNVLGDAITESASIYQTITKTFSVSVPSNVDNAENINFVAFIVDSNNQVVNVRAAHANENQDFEVNP